MSINVRQNGGKARQGKMVKQNGGGLEIGGRYIILKFFWRFLMMQLSKKILMRLSLLY